jgi:methyl-accepting chemotaxis protein
VAGDAKTHHFPEAAQEWRFAAFAQVAEMTLQSGLGSASEKWTPKPADRLPEANPMPKLDHETLLLACIAAIGLAMLLQTLILLLIFVAMRKAAASLREEAENLRASITPVIFDARDLLANTQGVLANAQEFLGNAQSVLTRVTPRIEAVTTDAVEVTRRLREQTAEFQISAQAILENVRRQSNRLDEMLSSLLDTMDHAGVFVAEAVSRPVRQVSSILRSAKAIIESLRTPVTRR